MYSQGFGSIHIQRMQILEENTGRGVGIELFEKNVYVLRDFGGIPFWDMHSQGFGRTDIKMMQIFNKNTTGVGGLLVLRNYICGIARF